MSIISSNLSRLKRLLLCVSVLAVATLPAQANPSGPTVRHGQVQISPGVQTQIEQLTHKAIIDWKSFSIGANESVRFLQPNDLSVILNRVTGGDPSKILGQLTANGNVFLINPNGILFGAGSVVNVGGFVASTLNISNEDFLAGQYVFKQDPNSDLAAIINQGKITITEGGYAVLTGPKVANEGQIVAKTGNIVLAAGEQSTLNLDGRDLIHFALKDQISSGAVVLAPGMLSDALADTLGVDSAKRADQMVRLPDGSVRLQNSSGTLVQSGLVLADGETGKNAGSVLLDGAQTTTLTAGSKTSATGIGANSDGGELLVLSTVDTQLSEQGTTRVESGASIAAGAEDGNGGFVEVSGNHVTLHGDIQLAAPKGKSGTFLLDPTNVRIVDGNTGPTTVAGEDLIGDGFIESMLAMGNFILESTTTITFDVTGTSGGGDSGIQSNSSNSLTIDTANMGGTDIFLGSDTIDIDGALSIQAGGSIDFGNSTVSSLSLDATANSQIQANGAFIDTRQDPNVLSGAGSNSITANEILLENSIVNFESLTLVADNLLRLENTVVESETELITFMGGGTFNRHIGDILISCLNSVEISGGSVFGNNIDISGGFIDSFGDIQGDADVTISGGAVGLSGASAGGTLSVSGDSVGIGSGFGSRVNIFGQSISLDQSFVDGTFSVDILADQFLDINNASISSNREDGIITISYGGDDSGFNSTALGDQGLSAADIQIATTLGPIDLNLTVNSSDFVSLANPPATDAAPMRLFLPSQTGNINIRDIAQSQTTPTFTRTPRGINLSRVTAANSVNIETPSDLVLGNSTGAVPDLGAPFIQTNPGGTVSLTAGRILDRNTVSGTGSIEIDTSGGGLGTPGSVVLTATQGGIGTSDALDGTTGAGFGPINFIADRITATSLGAGAPIRLATTTTPLQLINLSTNNGLVNLAEGTAASVLFSDAASSGNFELTYNNVTAPAFLFTNTGNVFLDQFTLAAGMTASLASSQGQLRNLGAGPAVVLNNQLAILSGGGGLGTSADPLRVSGGTAALSSTAGSIFVQTDAALNLTSVSVIDQGTTLASQDGAVANNDINIRTSAGNLDVNAPVTSTAGDVSLNATQTINLNSDISAIGSNVLLDAGDTIQKVSTSLINSSGLGLKVGNSLGSQGTPFEFQAENLVLETGLTGSAFLQEIGDGTTMVSSLSGAGKTLNGNIVGQNLEFSTNNAPFTIAGSLMIGNEAVVEVSRLTPGTSGININANVNAAKLALLAPGDISQGNGSTVTASAELVIKSGASVSGSPENFEIATQKLVVDAGGDALIRQDTDSLEVVDQISVLGTNYTGGNAGNNMRIVAANGNLTINSSLTAGADLALVTGSNFNILAQTIPNGGNLILNQNVGGLANFVGIAGQSIIQGNPATTINSPNVGLAANGSIGASGAPINTTASAMSLNGPAAFINPTGIPRVTSVTSAGVTVFDNGVVPGVPGPTVPGPGTPGPTGPAPTSNTPLVDVSLPQNDTELVEENLADPNLAINDLTWLSDPSIPILGWWDDDDFLRKKFRR